MNRKDNQKKINIGWLYQNYIRKWMMNNNSKEF